MYAKKASSSGSNGGSASSPTSFVRLAAEHAAKVSRAGKQTHSGGSADEENPRCSEEGFHKYVTRAWEVQLDWSGNELYEDEYEDERDEDESDEDCECGYCINEEEYSIPHCIRKTCVEVGCCKTNPDDRAYAMHYIRRMQQTSKTCIPHLPFLALVREIGQDYKTGLDFEPAALKLMQSMLEHYLVELFEDAVLRCIHDKRRSVVEPKDLQLAHRARLERA